MGQLADVEQVRDQPAHHLAGVVPVVVGVGQGHVLVKQVLAHVGLHAGAHDVAVGGHVELAHGPECRPGQQRRKQPFQRGQDALCTAGKQSLRQPPEDLRKRQINDAQRNGAHQIQNQKMFIGFVIGYKPLKNRHGFYRSFFVKSTHFLTFPFGEGDRREAVVEEDGRTQFAPTKYFSSYFPSFRIASITPRGVNSSTSSVRSASRMAVRSWASELDRKPPANRYLSIRACRSQSMVVS